jgi:hypothetical protein
MEIAATPPTTPPTIAPVFELLPPLDVGAGRPVEESPEWAETEVVWDPTDPPVVAPAAWLVTLLEVPSNLPGSISGESKSIGHGCEKLTVRKKKRIPTANGLRLIGIPIIPRLECCKYVAIEKKNIATNCHVKESPLGDTCTQRDRIRKPASHSHVNAKVADFQSREETHVEGGRTDVQLYENSDQLMANT